MRILFSSNISGLTEKNSSFDCGILRVAYTGRNRNNSFISKETFERCMPSIYNCPIVCRYDRESDVIGSHDMELVSDDDGGIRIVNITHPVGVIPESARYWWEEIEDDSGIHEYLCVDALIWKRQEAYKKIKEDGITDESMEISIKEGEMIDGVYVINRFEFTAFCLLGTAQPCYESASLEIFSCDNFKKQLADMMRELKESFYTTQHSHEVVIDSQNYSEGGEKVLERKKELAAEYEIDITTLDFSIDDFTIEELREKFESIKLENSKHSDSDESFALENQFREELFRSLELEKVETCWGTDSRYWLWDYDKDISEVYATDVSDWNLYGFTYSMDGDHVVIDFSTKKRMKIAITPFDEGSQADPISGMFAKVVEKYKENDLQWGEKYQAISSTISSMENELGALRQFKEDTEEAIANAAAKEERENIFSQFEDLTGIEAFETLRKHSMEYSPEILEEKCYAIRGKNGTTSKFSYEPKAPKLAIEKTGVISEPYGGVFAEYGITLHNKHN